MIAKVVTNGSTFGFLTVAVAIQLKLMVPSKLPERKVNPGGMQKVMRDTVLEGEVQKICLICKISIVESSMHWCIDKANHKLNYGR